MTRNPLSKAIFRYEKPSENGFKFKKIITDEINEYPPEGTYNSIVTTVELADGNATAFYVKYELVNKKTSAKYRFREKFMNDPGNDRTRRFFEYLDSNGVKFEMSGDLIGICEEVVIEEVVANNGYTYNNIVSRDLISHEKEEQ